jgi:hypothetical protein
MPSFLSALHLLVDHVWLAVVAALLFMAGMATAAPVVRQDRRLLMAFPLWVVRVAMRLMGPEMPPLRVFALIFTFNGAAIFLYMLSGVLIVVPAAMAFLTGLNIGVVVLKARELVLPGTEPPASGPEEPTAAPRWASFCGALVLALELPSFCLSVGMGIGMARKLTAPGQYTIEMVRALVAERIHAYWMIILPALLISALAETAAIRGQMRRG